MKKIWKWIIGIVLGLIVLVVLMGVGFMLRSNFHGYRGEAQVAPDFSQRGFGMMPYGGFEHMQRQGMMSRGMLPFGGFFGGLLTLGFLALVVLGIIWLVRRLRNPQPVVAAAVAGTAVAPQAVEAPVSDPAVMPASALKACKKCGQPIQDDWKVCPHCGKKV